MVSMHEGQWQADVETVVRLVGEQFPAWRELPVRPLPSHGTVNALFLVGDEVVLRFDLFPSDEPGWRAERLAAEAIVARLASRVAVGVPTLLGVGEPGRGYPGFWSAYAWIPGATIREAAVDDLDAFAADLAGFVEAVRSMPTDGRSWDGHSRGGPLAERDDQVRRCIEESVGSIDAPRVEATWLACLEAPTRERDVWIHADLMPGNLLVRDGRLAAVIDCEDLCIGDPAVDLMPAWNLLPEGPRGVFRQRLGVDDATWSRGRGWALCQAIVALPYYVETNEVMAETARHTLTALLG